MNKDIRTSEYMKRLEGMKLSESSRSRIGDNLQGYAQFHAINEGVRDGGDSRSIEQVPGRTSRITHILNLSKKVYDCSNNCDYGNRRRRNLIRSTRRCAR